MEEVCDESKAKVSPVIVQFFFKDGFRYCHLIKEGIGAVMIIKENDYGMCNAIFPANFEGKIISETPLLCRTYLGADIARKDFCRMIGKICCKYDESKYFKLQDQHPKLNKVLPSEEPALQDLIQKIKENTDLFVL